MQKTAIALPCFFGNGIIKHLLMMKLAIILSFVFAFQALADNTSAQTINLKLKNVSLKAAIKAIEAQGDYR